MITSLSQWDKVVGRGLAEEKKSEINLYFQYKGMNGYFMFALAVSKVFFLGLAGVPQENFVFSTFSQATILIKFDYGVLQFT